LVPPLALARSSATRLFVGANVPQDFDKVNAVNKTTPTPLGEHMREQARAHRTSAADHPDDPRYRHSADALAGIFGVDPDALGVTDTSWLL
jgi:hypothetical protein